MKRKASFGYPRFSRWMLWHSPLIVGGAVIILISRWDVERVAVFLVIAPMGCAGYWLFGWFLCWLVGCAERKWPPKSAPTR